ncbi:DNA-binding protein [Staphylococcus petrasii]|nr:DNA-binding protein [Staphylococcus petrasii]
MGNNNFYIMGDIQMREIIQNLLDSELSSLHIAKQTGVTQSTIYRIRTKSRSLDNLSLKNAELLYQFEMERMKMNELNNKMVEEVVLSEVELVEGLGQYFIDIEGDHEYDVEFATLSEVDYKDNTLYEVAISKTYEIPHHDKLEKEDMEVFYNTWLEKDQQEETYIESVFFVNKEDAESYIKDVLKGKESLTEVAEQIGYFE